MSSERLPCRVLSHIRHLVCEYWKCCNSNLTCTGRTTVYDGGHLNLQFMVCATMVCRLNNSAFNYQFLNDLTGLPLSRLYSIQCINPFPWWRHQMETFSALLAICAGNSPVTGEFPVQRPVTRSFNVSFMCVWINDWVNNREAVDLRHHRAHYDVTVMTQLWLCGSRDHFVNWVYQCSGSVIVSTIHHGYQGWLPAHE